MSDIRPDNFSKVRLNIRQYWITGLIILISGIRPDTRPNRISGQTLVLWSFSPCFVQYLYFLIKWLLLSSIFQFNILFFGLLEYKYLCISVLKCKSVHMIGKLRSYWYHPCYLCICIIGYSELLFIATWKKLNLIIYHCYIFKRI